MIEINPTRWKYPPLSYQLGGVKDLVTHPVFALFWEMRLRKSKVILDAAGELFQAGELEILIIACPAQVKPVWLGREFGEIVKHSWVPTKVFDHEAGGRLSFDKVRQFLGKQLIIIVTSAEFLRREDENDKFPNVERLLEATNDTTRWLVFDEGSAIANPASLSSRAVSRLRRFCSRFTLLDGTPSHGTMLSLYNKFRVMDPMILCLKNSREFKHRYCVVQRVREGRTWTDKVTGYQNLDELWRRTRNHCHRLEQKDVRGILDLPEFATGEITTALEPTTWAHYKRMRDEMLVQLETGERSWTNHASVKIMRLAQICNGFLGGFQDEIEKVTRAISQEATMALVNWLDLQLEADENFKCVAWCRWRPEIERLVAILKKAHPEIQVGQQWGDLKTENFLHPDHPYQGPGVMVCQGQAVQYGVSFAKAPAQVFLSQDYRLIMRLQSEQRIQDDVKKLGRNTTLMLDMLVTGPEGQRTVIHDIVRSLRAKEDVSRRLAAGWKRVLKEE